MVSLSAMRVGLLTRFLGYLGIIAGVLTIIPLVPIPIVEAYWLLALAYLFSGRWPSGVPPAWTSGRAEPWPKTPAPTPGPGAAARPGAGQAGAPSPRREPVGRAGARRDPLDDAQAQAQAPQVAVRQLSVRVRHSSAADVRGGCAGRMPIMVKLSRLLSTPGAGTGSLRQPYLEGVNNSALVRSWGTSPGASGVRIRGCAGSSW